MHPFSLDKTQQEAVVGGYKGEVFTLGEHESGDYYVTQAIPEDGSDPRPFPPMEIM